MIEYKIADGHKPGWHENSNHDVFILQRKVEGYMANGWELSGGIFVLKDGSGVKMYQAMTRDRSELCDRCGLKR